MPFFSIEAKMKKRKSHIKSIEFVEEVKLQHRLGARFKILDAEERIITGYASTDDLDRQQEIVKPEAFAATLKAFMENPVLLFGHEWWSKPIGKVLEAEVRAKGLWIKAQISKATEEANEVWGLIKEGILKAFSIGYRPIKWEDTDEDIRTILELELFEISMVSIPANPQALADQAKAKKFNLKTIKLTQEEEKVTDVVVKTPETLAEITSLLQGVSKDMAELKKARNEPDKEIPDEKVFLEKVTPKLTELINAEFEKKNKERPRPQLFDPKEAGIHSNGNGKQTLEELLQMEVKTPSNDFDRKVKEFHNMSDDVLIMDALFRAKYGHRYLGAKSLGLWSRYQGLTNELAKALDSATAAEGLEFMPTIISPELHELVRINLRLAALFQMFPMPSDIWKFPVAGADTVMKKVAETTAITVTPDTLEETPGTANVTFTAQKGRARVVVSNEAVENSIIDLMAFLKNKIAISIARGIETANISGDTTATHQDDDVHTGAGQANDFRRAWKGVRKLAIAGSNTVDFNGAFTIALLRSVREKLGKFGMIPTELAWSCAAKTYYKFIGLTTSAVGPVEQGILRLRDGVVEAFDGIQIIPSQEYPTNLAATGVNTLAGPNTFTAISLVHIPSLAHGVRRQTTLEVQRLAVQDQFEIISFWRGDLEAFFATAANEGPTAYGFEI
jgi:HK97 family phage prohead protease/HK97 family phage major capsid protein